MKKASVIVSIYSNVEALRLVLDSLSLQTDQRFEVIISEDANHTHVRKFLDDYQFKGDLTHLSHPDVGWTKNIALNKAIRHAKYDYLIFVDGDCVLHPRFVEYHLKYASDNLVLAGKRIKLDPITSQKILANEIPIEAISNYVHINFWKIKKQGALFVEEGFFLGDEGFLGFVAKIRKMTNLKGCNMSFSKKAIHDINGFDEEYIKPAIGEDIDLTWRFKKAGFSIKSVRNLAVQYHLHHKENWTDQSENQRMMDRKKEMNIWYCKQGLKHDQ